MSTHTHRKRNRDIYKSLKVRPYSLRPKYIIYQRLDFAFSTFRNENWDWDSPEYTHSFYKKAQDSVRNVTEQLLIFFFFPCTERSLGKKVGPNFLLILYCCSFLIGLAHMLLSWGFGRPQCSPCLMGMFSYKAGSCAPLWTTLSLLSSYWPHKNAMR